MNIWMIVHQDPNLDLFWSNDLGWTDQSDASTFSDREKKRYTLPLEGEWRLMEVSRVGHRS